MQITQTDPVIAEVWTVRDEHAARFGYDIAEIFRDIRATQVASGSEYVRYPPRIPSEYGSGMANQTI